MTSRNGVGAPMELAPPISFFVFARMLVGEGRRARRFPPHRCISRTGSAHKGIIAAKCGLSAGDAVLRGGAQARAGSAGDLHEPRIANRNAGAGIARDCLVRRLSRSHPRCADAAAVKEQIAVLR